MKQLLFLLTLFSLQITSGCHHVEGLSFVPSIPGYDEVPVHTILLKNQLREISGIDYQNQSELTGINDEDGILFFINSMDGSFRKVYFGKKGDYEDVVRTPRKYYVLKSNGDIHELDGSTGHEIAVYKHEFPNFTEFESLCYNANTNQLLMICKTCGRNEPFITGWRFDLITKKFLDEPSFTIPMDDIRRLGKDDTIEFQPSAAAFHPITGKLMIIASLGKRILQCDANGKPEAVYGINPYVFPQPEGLCFAPNGDMYISNEGRQSKATILFYPFKKQTSRPRSNE